MVPEGLKVKPLLLHIKKNQLRWFKKVIRMPPVFGVGGGPWARPKTHRRDYISRLVFGNILCPPRRAAACGWGGLEQANTTKLLMRK